MGVDVADADPPDEAPPLPPGPPPAGTGDRDMVPAFLEVPGAQLLCRPPAAAAALPPPDSETPEVPPPTPALAAAPGAGAVWRFEAAPLRAETEPEEPPPVWPPSLAPERVDKPETLTGCTRLGLVCRLLACAELVRAPALPPPLHATPPLLATEPPPPPAWLSPGFGAPGVAAGEGRGLLAGCRKPCRGGELVFSPTFGAIGTKVAGRTSAVSVCLPPQTLLLATGGERSNMDSCGAVDDAEADAAAAICACACACTAACACACACTACAICACACAAGSPGSSDTPPLPVRWKVWRTGRPAQISPNAGS